MTISSISNNFVLPMFAGACCLLQLMLNVLATVAGIGGGCAGFNTVFGPYRPYLLSILLYLSIFSNISTSPKIIIGRWTLALLPELLHAWNQLVSKWRRRSRRRKKNRNSNSSTKNEFAVAAAAQQYPIEATVQFDIPAMGCVACVNKIDSVLWKAPSLQVIEDDDLSSSPSSPGGGKVSILDATSSLHTPNNKKKKGGYATVRFVAETPADIDLAVQAFVDAIHSAGFGDGCLVQSFHQETATTKEEDEGQ